MRCRVPFTGTAKRQPRSSIEQQNHAIELPVASAARERHANRMKHRAAAVRHGQLHPLDNLLEPIGIDVAAFEDAIGELADHVARPFAREDSLVRSVL